MHMIRHRRRKGDTPAPKTPLDRPGLSSLRGSARAYLLLTEVLAATITGVLIAVEPTSKTLFMRFVMLAVLAIGYSEVAAHSTRMQRYLGSNKVFSNPMSVWSFAAVLTLPAGWAATFVAVQYAHAMWQRRRDASGPPYRLVFTGAAAMLAQLATAVLISVGDRAGGAHGHALASLAALAAMPLFFTVNLLVVLTAVRLTVRATTMRALIPDGDAVGYELGTLVLGLATSEFLIHSPVLTPAALVLVTLLHRSSVVKSLQKSARTDSKTGLLTAAAWTESATTILTAANQTGTSVAVLLIDLDHFKTVNDTCGHLSGDRVLVAVADSLRRELRGHDGVGRFGGEELVAILDGPSRDEAIAVAERLRRAIGRLHVDGAPTVTASVGVVHTGSLPTPFSLDDLIERADRALYQAKQDGRDLVRIADVPAER